MKYRSSFVSNSSSSSFCIIGFTANRLNEDELYEQYNKLYKHFDGIKPNGCI